MSERVFFVSDAHFKMDPLKAHERARREKFASFLASIRGAESLYLLGDMFDFWFESRNFVPHFYDDILDALLSIKNSGTAVYLAGGNHDWWLGDHIEKKLGFTVMPTIATQDIQGHRVTMTHGDSLLPGDIAYKVLKTAIRSRPVIAIARRVPPGILFGFAKIFSATSKQITESYTERSARKLIAAAPREFFKWGNDIFIMGHVHKPCLERFGERTFAIVGDWERFYSYLVLENGELSPGFYRP